MVGQQQEDVEIVIWKRRETKKEVMVSTGGCELILGLSNPGGKHRSRLVGTFHQPK